MKTLHIALLALTKVFLIMSGRCALILGLGMLLVSALPLKAELRSFKSADGSKSFYAEFLSFDNKKKLVMVRMSSGREMSFPISLLSKNDQDWVAAKKDIPVREGFIGTGHPRTRGKLPLQKKRGNLVYGLGRNDVSILWCDESASGELIIPQTIEGKPVTDISSLAFYNCTALTAIKIPDGVSMIRHLTFYNCRSLTSISLPASVEFIFQDAFRACDKLRSITMPGVKTIERDAFAGCTSLKKISIGNELERIFHGALRDCPYPIIKVGEESKWFKTLNGVLFQNPASIRRGGPTVVVTGAQDNMRLVHYPSSINEKSYTLPDDVTSLSGSAFYKTKLTHIRAGVNNKNFKDVDGVLFSKDMEKLSVYPAGKTLTTYSIPDSVNQIGSAFSHCTALKAITIPEGVASIGSNAFYKCSSLTVVMIPNSVTKIGSNAFRDCTKLTSVMIGNGVTSIGDYAFAGCSSLTNITIPASVRRIGGSAFDGCTDLMAVTFLGNGNDYHTKNNFMLGQHVFDGHGPKFGWDNYKGATPTIYRKSGAKGWRSALGGRPVRLIRRKP